MSLRAVTWQLTLNLSLGALLVLKTTSDGRHVGPVAPSTFSPSRYHWYWKSSLSGGSHWMPPGSQRCSASNFGTPVISAKPATEVGTPVSVRRGLLGSGELLPKALTAVTRQRTRWPASAACTVYWGPEAPLMAAQPGSRAPFAARGPRSQTGRKEVVPPIHEPCVQASFWPTCGVPDMAGLAVLNGGAPSSLSHARPIPSLSASV